MSKKASGPRFPPHYRELPTRKTPKVQAWSKRHYAPSIFTLRPLSKTILAVLATGLLTCALSSQQAQAIPINGSITFDGGCTLDTGNANTANAVTSWQNTVVQSVSGDLDTFINPLDSATFSAPWLFDPSTPTPALWSVGGFTFDLLASTIVFQGNGFLSVSGTGTISGNGFDPTFGTWSFSTQNPSSNGIFSFSAAGQAVPDGGSAVALLGLALTGIEVVRRKLKPRLMG